jgi:hypothetical protein
MNNKDDNVVCSECGEVVDDDHAYDCDCCGKTFCAACYSETDSKDSREPEGGFTDFDIDDDNLCSSCQSLVERSNALFSAS